MTATGKIFVFVVATFLLANASICHAEAIYETSEYVPEAGTHNYMAYVSDFFAVHERIICISIGKSNLVEDGNLRDFYTYLIEIMQPTFMGKNPFDVKSVTIMSELDSVEISTNNSYQQSLYYRQKGLSWVTDRILYLDPGRMNRVIKNVISKNRCS